MPKKSAMTQSLADKYDLRVPRYTSYPTAPHFTAAIDADVYARWLGELNPEQPLSLYFHIPFCDSMCWFCGCYTKIVNRYEPIRLYLDVLLREMDLVADALPGRFKASHLHWGGGSPTMLISEDWLAILDALRKRFDVVASAEIAVELDPRDVTEDYVKVLSRAGVTRASIGVQDFHPDVQAAINREQPFEEVERVCAWLHSYGIAHLNLDLMYGLPRQTTERVIAMVDSAVRLEPARLALFGYAHVPWMKSHQKMIDEAALPSALERLEQFDAASERLQAHGYRAIGLDHFAKPNDTLTVALDSGRLRRNFQGYTIDDAAVLLGLGASAIGSLPQGYVQNVSPLNDHHRAVDAGRLPTVRGVALDESDRLRAEIIERLMCELAVDVDAVCRRHHTDPSELAPALERLDPLIEDGIATVEGLRVKMTSEGRPFLRLVAAAFDAYLETGVQRHARAV